MRQVRRQPGKEKEKPAAIMAADDLLSEISTPDINHSERTKI